MKEVTPGESSSDSEDENTMISEFETLFVMNEDERSKKLKKETSPNQKSALSDAPKQIMQMAHSTSATSCAEKRMKR